MNEPRRPALVALFLLTVVTGAVDAASVLGPGHVFTANMTGNVVFLGFALAGAGGRTSVTTSVNAIASFLAGAVVGGRLSKVQTPRSLRLGFGMELGVLALAAGVSWQRGALALVVSLLACSMGLRNAIVRSLAIPDMTTTVLTLTLTGLAADSWMAGGANPRWMRRVVAIASMLAGALLGATLLPLGMSWVIGAAVVVEAMAVATLMTGVDALGHE